MSSPTFTLPFNLSEDLIPSQPSKAPGTTSISFDNLLSPPLKLHEDLKEGCGGQMWPAGMVLAQYLLARKEECMGKTIVELGAGGGLVGLALALSLSQSQSSSTTRIQPSIHITDVPPLLPLQATNIALNALPPSLVVSTSLSWGTPLSLTSLPPSHYQPSIILAADCVYFEPAFPLLLQTLHEMVGEKTVCWFCFVKRRRADMGFVRRLRKGFDVREVNMSADGFSKGEKGVFMYEVRKRKFV